MNKELQELQTLHDELQEMRERIDALEIKREAVFSAMNEVDGLQDDVAKRARKIKQHLRDAL